MNPTVRSTNSPGRTTRPSAPVYRHPPPQPRPRPQPPSDDEDDDDEDSDDDELGRPGSSGSDASSNITTVSAAPITPINTHAPAAGYFSPQMRSASTTTSPQHAARAMPQDSGRQPSGRGPSIELPRHRSRHHSQGFFEPSLPTASSDQMPAVSASRIAAQAAMQQMKRPQNVVPTFDDGASRVSRRSGSASPPLMPPPLRINQPSPSLPPPSAPSVATTAANVVFPRAGAPTLDTQLPEKQKKKKLFSKPKHIGISRDKDSRDRGLPSPSKLPGLSRMVSASTTSLADLPSNNSSMYNLSNASVSTVVPADRAPAPPEKDKDKDKDKHKHHFLSRQKLKLKDRDDHFNLPLSSASSNSRPADPNAPQSLYSFTSPASPAPGATFGKSVSGLDLLHGGRALREKKKEEKALAESDTMEWLANSASGPTTPGGFAGPSSLNSSSGVLGEAVLRETLQGFGLNNMSPEDAWDFLKAKLLVIFDGEDVRIAIEDLNKLVLVHLQRCVHKRAPTAVITDLQELLETGFATLNHSSLVGIPDEKLVPHLVQIWMLVFGTILPFIQAVFLPLDLEFKGVGTLMTSREAREFWGALPAGGSLDVRNIVLIAFRDRIILNRYETLKATFSRLSLDSINSGFPTLSVTAKSTGVGGRPGTAASLDAGLGSYNSQSSTLLSTGIADSYSSDSMSALARPTSSDSRSRAASNTSSNPDPLIFSSISPQTSNQRPTIIHRGTSADSSHVITETVGRMLQCVSVLASVQTDDPSQEKIEVLSKALKHNWLGRGRTGRDRRGFVGAKIRPVMVGGTPSLDGGDSLTTAGISIGASTSTSGSRARGDSSSSDWSSGQGVGNGISMRSGGRRELSVL
ncbi:Target of rapamycin complex 2 subunit bit61 [Penicillium subrubescens]|uniref:Target of rapamycin complex 2 subunit bit61 n=1 Tax=Penicillium subrubescens TaxID=1316194 RepID=A0A1Q5SNQ3_9EURO|nr:Target of rapamycin complex 2 subunit bit61 [Penicillium subrubescens]